VGSGLLRSLAWAKLRWLTFPVVDARGEPTRGGRQPCQNPRRASVESPLKIGLLEGGWVIIPGDATHAYSQYHHFHLNFNRRIKTAAVAIALLEADWKSGRTDEAIKEAARIWGGWPDWSDKTAALSDARFDLGAGGIVKVFSALDVFIEALEGEMHAWAAAPNRKDVVNHADPKGKHDGPLTADGRTAGREESDDEVDDESDLMKTRALKVYHRHGWSAEGIGYLAPVYRYLVHLRHCVAHADARVGPALARASRRERWEKAIANWPSLTGDVAAPVPTEMDVGEPIQISHKDALLASSLVGRLALDMSTWATSTLGADGVLYLAAARLLKQDDVAELVGKTPFIFIHRYLHEVLRVKELNEVETKRILERVGIWKDICRRHEELRKA
jgi:hypothetical protein